jgi:N-terminal domain of reverse transcriptase
MNTVDTRLLDGGDALCGEKIERRVFKLQTRSYRAQRRGNGKPGRNLQSLLLKSRSATL